MAKTSEILGVVRLLEASFDVILGEDRLNAYLRMLDDIPPAVLEAAAVDWVKGGKPFFPKVTELRSLALEVQNTGQGNAVAFNTDTTRHPYWQAMDKFARNLRGEITDEQLDADRDWRLYAGRLPAVPADPVHQVQ